NQASVIPSETHCVVPCCHPFQVPLSPRFGLIRYSTSSPPFRVLKKTLLKLSSTSNNCRFHRTTMNQSLRTCASRDQVSSPQLTSHHLQVWRSTTRICILRPSTKRANSTWS